MSWITSASPKNLKNALAQYSRSDQEKTGIDEEQAVQVLREKYEIVRAMFRPDMAGGYDYRPALSAATPPPQRLTIMSGAIEWVLAMQQEEAAKESSKEAKKQAHRRYADAVLNLTKPFALASETDAAAEIRDEIGFSRPSARL